MVESLAQGLSGEAIDAAVEEYLEIGGMVSAALAQQVEFDLDNLARATGRTLDRAEREAFVNAQVGAQRWTYLGSGMIHPRFVATLRELRPAAADRVAKVAEMLC